MAERYIFEEKVKPSSKTTGYGKIIDTQPEVYYENEIVTVYGKKKAMLILRSLNLLNDLLKLRKRARKKDIIEILNKYGIKI